MSTSRFDLRALRDRDELTAVGKAISAEIKADDVPTLAAAVSFKIVLALFPALLAAVAIFALVTDANELTGLLDNLPDNVTAVVRPQLEDFIDQAASGGIAVGGIAIGLWAASSAAVTLNKALTRAFDEADDRKLIGARTIALAVTVALLVALIAISVLLVAGSAIEDRILGRLPLTETAGDALDAASTLGRYVSAIVLLMLLFAFIYWIGPAYERRPRWAWITPGAALAVIAWLVASALFGWYVATFGSYTGKGSIYGPLGSAIVYMLWLQLSMFALLLGAEVNQVLVLRARVRRSGDDAGAGSVGTGEDGSPARSPVAAGAGPTTTGDGGVAAGSGLRAATTPTRGRAGLARPRPTVGRTDAGTSAPTSAVTEGTGRAPGADAHGGRAAGAGPAQSRRSLPAATLIGAGIAAVSSLVGLTGLLRRLKG